MLLRIVLVCFSGVELGQISACLEDAAVPEVSHGRGDGGHIIIDITGARQQTR